MPVEAKERQLPVATSPNLDDMKLPELKELAKQMGLRGVSTMRKTELIATLQAARSGGQAPAGVTVRAPKSAPAADAEVKSAKDKKADEAKQEERPVRAKQAKSAESSEVADAVAAVDALKPNDEAPKRRRHRDAEAGADLLAELGLDDAAPKQDDRRRRRDDDRRDDFEPRRRRRVADGPKSEDVVRDLDDILATLPSQEDADDDKRRDETEDNEYRHSRGRNDRRGRRMRGRDRDYDERDERRGRGDRNDRNDRNDRADRMDRSADRNIENGGSLTIISSALVETGSKMDEVIFEEFKGTGNMELRLSRELADKRLFPAIDVNASGTRREELITDPQELPIIYRLRRLLGGLEPEQAYQTLVPRLKKTATNRDFMASLIQQSGNATNGN